MTKKQIYLSVIFGAIFLIALCDFLPGLKKKSDFDTPEVVGYQYKKDSSKTKDPYGIADQKGRNYIEKLTDETIVINYVKKHKRLPEYYITKAEAKRQGWRPSEGNLCDVLPNRAIGGDRFSNREKKLPDHGKYYEADINYRCGRRNAERIVFNEKGDVWLTKNHYKSFEKQ